eukprot:14112144-Alexandrium_andersonii.AAC.1
MRRADGKATVATRRARAGSPLRPVKKTGSACWSREITARRATDQRSSGSWRAAKRPWPAGPIENSVTAGQLAVASRRPICATDR